MCTWSPKRFADRARSVACAERAPSGPEARREPGRAGLRRADEGPRRQARGPHRMASEHRALCQERTGGARAAHHSPASWPGPQDYPGRGHRARGTSVSEYGVLAVAVVLVSWVAYAVAFRIRRRWLRDDWYRRQAHLRHGHPFREDC